MTLFTELRRRNVLRVGAAYVVVAWVIVEVALVLREIFGFDIWIVRILTILLALGVVPVLVFAWLYELTPEGFKRDAEIGSDRAYADASGRKLIYVTVGAVFIGVAILGVIWPPPPPPPPPERAHESLAVMPFVNLSADPDNKFLSDGLTNTLNTMLSPVQGLTVTPNKSVLNLPPGLGIAEIADRLNVAHVLEGSVQRAGDTVRVTAQLVSAENEETIWAEKFDRKLKDIFAIQDEIASQVGIRILAGVWNPSQLHRVGTEDFLAYESYLKAWEARNREGRESLWDAERMAREALAADPSFLDAKALLADVLTLQADNGFRLDEEADKEARALLEEVVAEDPDHVWGRSFLALMDTVEAVSEGDFEAVNQAVDRVRNNLRLAPNNVDVRMIFARVAGVVGAHTEAIEVLKRAAEIDPLNAEIHFWLASQYGITGDLEHMRQSMQHVLEIEPDNPAFHQIMGSVGASLGDGKLAICNYVRAVELDPLDEELPGSAAEYLYLLGLPEEAREFHDRVLERARDSEMADNLDMIAAWTGGDEEKALELAREVIRNAPYERWTAWRTAWKLLLFTSVARGTVQEDVEFMDTYLPGYSDLDRVVVAPGVGTIRAQAPDVLLVAEGEDAVKDYIERATVHWKKLNDRDEDFPQATLHRLLIMDGPDVATEWALDAVFTRAVTDARVKYWRLRYSRPFLAPVVEDPRVREALDRWEVQEAKIRSEVRDIIAGGACGEAEY